MYYFLWLHYTRWTWLFFILSFFMRIRIYPRSLTKESFNAELVNKSVIYVLPRMSIIDMLVLNKTLRALNQKKVEREARPHRFEYAAVLALKPRSIPFYNHRKDEFSDDFVDILQNDKRIQEDKIVFVPVSVFWSRAPDREEKGFLLRSLFPDDGTGNGLQKLFMLILHRGEVNIAFGKSFDAAHLGVNGPRMQRLFNIEFAKERAAAFGPTLYDKDKICRWILSSHTTKKLIKASDNPLKTEIQIVRYIHEIAANYNYVTIRALEKVFDFIWNRVFDGVRVKNFELVERIAKEGQVMWMPSHRSHFDYLLLSYVLFKRGFVIPHIAAGINLNFWPIGSILRRGGAFFIRRSFAGNRIYANTFSEYVNFLMQNSFPVEFFQEGGRSRIVKLLTPKLGMLSICIQSVLQRKAEATYLVPVYFCYDKVMEENSYAKELKGAKKQKENVLQFLNGIRKVFSNYGSATVSFGDPLKIKDVWEEYIEKVRKDVGPKLQLVEHLPNSIRDLPDQYDIRDPYIQGFIKYLGMRLSQKINCAAIASNTSLLSTTLLAQRDKKLSYQKLQHDVLLLHYLMNSLGHALHWKLGTLQNDEHILEFLLSQNDKSEKHHFKNIFSITDQIFAMGEKWGLLKKEEDQEFKQRYFCNVEKEFNLWWYRGTIFHAMAPFAILATFLLNAKSEERTISRVEAKISTLRRIWQDELYWDHATSSMAMTMACLHIFQSLEFVNVDENTKMIYLTENNSKQELLEFLSRIIQPEIELYKIQIMSALDLVRSKGHFLRDELGQKAFTDHTLAFFQSHVTLPAIFSKVFAQRIFDAFYKAGIFVPAENQKLLLNTAGLAGISDFFNLKL